MVDTKKYGLGGIGGNVELGKGGPRVKDESGVVAFRNNVDSQYARIKAGLATSDDDVVTKQYLDSYGLPVVIGNIYDSGGSTPASTQFTSAAQEGKLAICNESVGAFVANRLYRLDRWDVDVENSLWTEIIPTDGMRMTMAVASSGGSTSYSADHVYLWDATGATWIDVGPAAVVSQVTKSERGALAWDDSGGQFNIGNAAPLNARVRQVIVQVTEAWDDAGVLTVGDAGDPDRFAESTEIDLTTEGIYIADCYHNYGSSTQITGNYTAGGSESQGAALIEVVYSIP